MYAKQNRREKSRLIESTDRRIVHFIFNPGQPSKVSPFTRKFIKFLEGPEELREFERADADAFDQYIESIGKEEDDAVDDLHAAHRRRAAKRDAKTRQRTEDTKMADCFYY